MSEKRQFISYPKSGRSWIRYVLHLLELEDQVQFHHDGCEFSDASKPPLALDFATRLEAYSDDSRVVYLHRDPYDVMVSLYFQVTGRMSDVFSIESDLSAFLRDEYFGAISLYTFDSQWKELCRRGLALCITYESCHANLIAVMRKILTWYDFDVSDQELHVACENAEFDKMRMVELSDAFGEPWLRPRNGATKTRRGIVGGYVDFLSPCDIAFLEEVNASMIQQS